MSNRPPPFPQRFMKVYEQLVEEIIADERNDGQARAIRSSGSGSETETAHRPSHCPNPPAQTENAVTWIKEMTDYNVPKGKLNRGLAVLDGAFSFHETLDPPSLAPALFAPQRSDAAQ